MNCKDIYNAFEYDLPKVKYRIKHMVPKVVKELQKECKFPAWRICKYTVPESCNTYNLCYYAEFPENAQSPINIHYCIADTAENETIIRALTGKYLKPDGEIAGLKQVHLYTYHFLEQYNNRFLKNSTLSHEEIACMFMCRNRFITPIRMNDRINRNFKKHGRFNSYVYEVRDGVCFALTSFEYDKDEENNLIPDDVGTLLILFTTFMNKNDMSEEQLKGLKDEQKQLINTIDEKSYYARDDYSLIKLAGIYQNDLFC